MNVLCPSTCTTGVEFPFFEVLRAVCLQALAATTSINYLTDRKSDSHLNKLFGIKIPGFQVTVNYIPTARSVSNVLAL
jgi:hypothetical protein